MVGTFFEYRDYIEFIERKGRYEKTQQTIVSAFLTFLCSVACLGINIVFGMYFDIYACGSEEFTKQSFWYNLYFYNMGMTGRRFLYYTNWKI
jgi:midasin (ATPase involved in ribosome maturation)